jgi:hypothetical protein
MLIWAWWRKMMIQSKINKRIGNASKFYNLVKNLFFSKVIENVTLQYVMCILNRCYCMEVRGAYNILVGRPEGRRPLGRPRHRWEDNIKMDLRDVDWIHWAQYRDRWWALVNTVMNLRVP